ncbi:hypothetical protein HSBAA_39040 [Vreelandella sulfidaeris]|uniref:CobN/magnesium chelatase domain-containing protein n=1 Tax=Vreelandella sulfidaeris TaxID=115553 RepID=A0A455UE34_9GAMM|nr:hypothetical protein HSBAA_39040 [Halomonas sulfidaeris]
MRLANWMNLVKPAAYDLYEDRVLEKAQLVIVSLLGGKAYWPYGHERLLAWAAAKPGRQLILVPGCDAPDDALLEDSTIPFDDAYRVWRYLREGGTDNAEQLLRFVANEYMDRPLGDWQEPKVIPPAVIYASQEQQASSLSEWRNRQVPGRPVCLLLFYRSHLQGRIPPYPTACWRRLKTRGLSPWRWPWRP